LPHRGRFYTNCTEAVMHGVYINRLSTYLPNDPVPNSAIEDFLGHVNGEPSRIKSLILRNNGITTRYYAFKDGKSTHSNAELTALAVKALFPDGKVDTDLLACGTTLPDQLLPSHATMTLGLLNTHPTETVTVSGACCSSIGGLKHAFLAIKAGAARNAVSAGSEKFSNILDAAKFNGEFGGTEGTQGTEDGGYLAFEKDFLRYMLSDGAAAAYLTNEPNEVGLSLSLDWIDMISFSNELETCMYAGSLKDETGNVIGWRDTDAQDWRSESIFALKQDIRLLAKNIVSRGAQALAQVLSNRRLNVDMYRHFLPHLSSFFFRDKIHEALSVHGLSIPDEIWFTNLDRVGNVGAAAPFCMLDELLRSGRLNRGEKILLMVPESARFSYAYIQLTVV
jgi:3-oxoacyl-[acyl-carrier-protein] synthase III